MGELEDWQNKAASQDHSATGQASDLGQTTTTGSVINMETQRQPRVFRESRHGPDLVLSTANENLPNDLLNTGLSPGPLQLGNIRLLLLAAGTSSLSQNPSISSSQGMAILVPKPKPHMERSWDWKWHLVEKPSNLAHRAAGHRWRSLTPKV